MLQYRGGMNPQMKQYVDAMVESVRQSCKEDHWSAEITKCVLAQDPSQNIFSYQTCTEQMGQPLMQKLQERYQKLLQQAQK